MEPNTHGRDDIGRRQVCLVHRYTVLIGRNQNRRRRTDQASICDVSRVQSRRALPERTPRKTLSASDRRNSQSILFPRLLSAFHNCSLHHFLFQSDRLCNLIHHHIRRQKVKIVFFFFFYRFNARIRVLIFPIVFNRVSR